MKGVSREYMIDKLLLWNPHWEEKTILGWKFTQLVAIYNKERNKTVNMVIKQLQNS